MKAIRIPETHEFDAKLAEVLSSAPGPVYVLLFGSEDPATGESWCRDCVIADPLIRKYVNKVPNSTLLECPVGPRSVYKNVPTHPYRVHPQIKLVGVPTILEWTKDGPGKRLVEEGAQDENNLKTFFGLE
ncbi:Thioredoxin domain-containing protein 17 [Rhizophlyctis rosea]|uniref:Thioredoxin domain-containing protein 17 n=1 Tax=Rhizophlyctis rosea TaxID=64517 RepID=A0AAD5SG58_9FUNG|nr:Thioredoxin domain-containing protein 17 [Rhizophlyctis rosea]